MKGCIPFAHIQTNRLWFLLRPKAAATKDDSELLEDWELSILVKITRRGEAKHGKLDNCLAMQDRPCKQGKSSI